MAASMQWHSKGPRPFGLLKGLAQMKNGVENLSVALPRWARSLNNLLAGAQNLCYATAFKKVVSEIEKIVNLLNSNKILNGVL